MKQYSNNSSIGEDTILTVFRKEVMSISGSAYQCASIFGQIIIVLQLSSDRVAYVLYVNFRAGLCTVRNLPCFLIENLLYFVIQTAWHSVGYQSNKASVPRRRQRCSPTAPLAKDVDDAETFQEGKMLFQFLNLNFQMLIF